MIDSLTVYRHIDKSNVQNYKHFPDFGRRKPSSYFLVIGF